MPRDPELAGNLGAGEAKGCEADDAGGTRPARGTDRDPELARAGGESGRTTSEQRRELVEGGAALIVKKLIVRAGLDPRSFAGHSLRAGFLTSAASTARRSSA